jgi:thiol-disulfide isomerase/thioredoxin
MAFLAAAVVLVGALSLLNLVFTFGVIRRLREHTEILDRLDPGAHSVMLEPGQPVADFSAITVDGQPVSANWTDGGTLVGFFSPTCAPCQTQLPTFVDNAKHHRGGREFVLAVVVGDSDEAAAPLVADLGGVARVVREADGGQLSTAFGVRGFPAFALVEPSGQVGASGSDILAVTVSALKI